MRYNVSLMKNYLWPINFHLWGLTINIAYKTIVGVLKSSFLIVVDGGVYL